MLRRKMSFIQKFVYRAAILPSLSAYRKCGNRAKLLYLQTMHKPFPLLSNRKYSERKVIFGNQVTESKESDTLEADVEGKVLKQRHLKEDTNNEVDFTLLPSIRREQMNDLLTVKLNGSSSAHEVFALLSQYLEIMTEQHVLSAAHKLASLVATGKEDANELQKNKGFLLLSTKLLKVSRHLEVNEVVNLLKFLTRLKVDVESRLMQSVLQLIRHHLNDMEAIHLIHTHFILMKMPKTPLGSALQIALPIVFDSKSDAERKAMLEELQVRELAQLLGICIRGHSRSTGQILQVIYEKGTIVSPTLMMSLLWALLTSTNSDSYNSLTVEEKLTREILIKECLEGLTAKLDQLSIGQIETTLSKQIDLYEKGDRSVYNEHFFETVVHQVLISRSSYTSTCFVALKLLKMNFLPEELLHYIVDYTIRNPKTVLTSQIPVMPIINGLASCKNQPIELEEALQILLQHNQVKDFKTNWKKPWIRLAVDLLCLGFYHEQLVATIFNPRFKITSNHVNKVQLLRLHQALKAFNGVNLTGHEELLEEARQMQRNTLPLKSNIDMKIYKILENTKLCVSGVISKQYLYIDHLLAVDSRGKPIPIVQQDLEEHNVSIEDLMIPETATLIAVQEVSPRWTLGPDNTIKGHIRLEHEMLEKEGLEVVALPISVLEGLSPDESIYYIQNQMAAKGVNVI